MSRSTRRQKDALLALAARLGVEDRLRSVWQLRNQGTRRDRRDGEHLSLLLAFTLSPNSNCVDIGAHDGEVTREFARLAPVGRHFAFEPLPELCEQVRREFPHVGVHQLALSDHAGEATFTRVLDTPALSGLSSRAFGDGSAATEQLTVETARLDDVLPPGYAPDFIKVDVEGAERLVFEGAMETITRHRPAIWFEHGIGGAEYFDTSSGDIFELLAGRARLRIFDADGRGPLSRAEFEALFREPMWSYLARR